MKKATIFLVVLALALMTVPVLADCVPGCEVINGNFAQADMNGWTLTRSSTSQNYFAKVGSGNSYAEAYVKDSRWTAIGQVFFEPDWDPLMLHKEFTASVKMDTKADWEWHDGLNYGAGTLVTTFYYYAGSEAGDPAPAFSATNPVGWTVIKSFTAVDPFNGYPDFGDTAYSCSGKLDTQPYWLAVGVVLQGTDTDSYGKFYGAVDDICFIGRCVDPVPLPPSALLLSSGLMGLGLLGWRRKKNLA